MGVSFFVWLYQLLLDAGILNCNLFVFSQSKTKRRGTFTEHFCPKLKTFWDIPSSWGINVIFEMR